ncbi:MAG: hypothetical protein OEL76_18775, partial [Siculibacillus sp.]|nr:hypothetical protein [Siculibacillus sp.]
NIGDTSPPAAEAAAHDEVLAKPFDLGRLLDILQVQLGLEWFVGGEPPAGRPQAPAPAPPPPPGPPAGAPKPAAEPERGEIAEMLQLARIGYVRGLDQKLTAVEARLAGLGGPPHPRVVEMRRALADFDMARMVSELESFDADA